MEPVAGIPHGGFYEGGRAQEANRLKARPYPPRHHAFFAPVVRHFLGAVMAEYIKKLAVLADLMVAVTSCTC